MTYHTSTGGQRTTTRPASRPSTIAASRNRRSGATSARAPTTRATSSISSRLSPSVISPMPMERLFDVPAQLSLPRCRRGGVRITPSDAQVLADLRAGRLPPSPSLICRTHHLSWSRAARLVATYARDRHNLPTLPL